MRGQSPPHVAQNSNGRRSAIDGRTTRHPGYAVSQRIRKRVEEAFGRAKTVAGLRKMRHRGLPKVAWQLTLAMAAITSSACQSYSPSPHHDRPSPAARRPPMPRPPTAHDSGLSSAYCS